MGESDVVARALGAGGPKKVIIAGKECIARPIGLKELTEIQREALDFYRDQYLRGFSAGCKYLENGQAALQKEVEKISKWDVDDLPKKCAYDPSKVKQTEALTEKLTGLFGKAVPDGIYTRMVASALDQGLIKDEEYETLTGRKAPKVQVPYDSWWITGCLDGMLTFVWKCFSIYGVTKDQVTEALGGDISQLSEFSREIEHLTVPAGGNG